MTFPDLSPADWAALAFYLVVWLGYEPILRRVAHRAGAINTDLTVLRAYWMRAMAGRRESRFIDGQLLGHALNSASFFTSSTLILIAGVAGFLFNGRMNLNRVVDVGVASASSHLLHFKLALVLLALVRGILSFIWAIRQLNYCLVLIGAAPESEADPELLKAYGEASSDVINPALSAFSQGIRGYYFALAAAGWLFGPIVFGLGTAAAFALLVYRQSGSRSARGVRRIRGLLEGPR